MNICYLIDVHPSRFNGGGQIHLSNLVREVKRSDLAARSDLIIFAGVSPILFIRICWMLLVIPHVVFHHCFVRRFDLIHAHSIPAMIPAKVLSLLLGVPVVVTVHGHTLFVEQNSYIRFQISYLKMLMEKFVLTKIRYDAQISVSRDFLKIPNVNKRIVYIPNGVDLSRFKKSDLGVPASPAGGRQGQTLSESPVILFVGRKTDPIKGFSILEKAMITVHKQFPSIRLLVADGSVTSSRLPHLYRSSTLLVIPSISEGFPLTLLEAWASSLPVVATSVGEIPYLFRMTARSLRNFHSGKLEVYETSRGYVVNPGRVEALANAILKALENPNLAQMGENGYNVAKRYTWNRVARNTQKIYLNVLSSRLTH